MDLKGQKIGRLLPLDYSSNGRERFWRCLCDCGNIKSIRTASLVNGKTKSCGCLRQETASQQGKKIAGKASPNRMPQAEAAKRHALQMYKRGAKNRGLKWELTDEEALRMLESNCHYCFLPPRKNRAVRTHKSTGTFYCNGIDRIDSNSGYVIQNCVPCCAICNRAKGAGGYVAYFEWLYGAAKRLKKYKNDIEKRSQSQ